MSVVHRRPLGLLPGRLQRRGERGVAIVEAAFAIPVMFLLILGLTDIGNAIFQTSQASGAAADGARAAITIDDLSGAETGGPAHEAIKAAVMGRLVSAETAGTDITISCRHGDGTTVACADASDDPRRDTIVVQVEVSWDWEPLSFVGHSIPVRTIEASSTMGLVVLPMDLPPTSAVYQTTTTAATP